MPKGVVEEVSAFGSLKALEDFASLPESALYQFLEVVRDVLDQVFLHIPIGLDLGEADPGGRDLFMHLYDLIQKQRSLEDQRQLPDWCGLLQSGPVQCFPQTLKGNYPANSP